MPSPVKPNQIFESIASMDGDFCEKFIASLNAPALFAQWYRTVFKADGTLTDEFKAMVCLGTAGTEGDPVTPPVAPPVVAPPTPPTGPVTAERPPPPVAVASRGSYPTMIRVSFTTSSATRYVILRDGVVIGQVDTTGAFPRFDDQVQPGRAYNYTVVAINLSSGLASLPSNTAFGYSAGYTPGLPPQP